MPGNCAQEREYERQSSGIVREMARQPGEHLTAAALHGIAGNESPAHADAVEAREKSDDKRESINHSWTRMIMDV